MTKTDRREAINTYGWIGSINLRKQKPMALMMEIEIVETSLVVPNEDTPKHKIWLSSIDLRLNDFYARLFNVYRLDDAAALDPNSTIDGLKLALSKALVPFYPMAGRLERDAAGRCEIDCTGQGALFVVAQSKASIAEIDKFSLSPELKNLLLPVPDRSAEPPNAYLFAVQLTFFRCGTLILGMATNHIAVDGRSVMHFISTWANIARGVADYLPIKPSFDRSSLRPRSPPLVTFDHFEHKPSSPNPNPNQQYHYTSTATESSSSSNIIFKLSRDQLTRLKSLGENRTSSTFRAITAHAWRCICVARNMDTTSKTSLCMVIDVRRRFNPPLPQGYFGNAVCLKYAVATAGDIVISDSLDFAVDKISEAIETVNDEYLRSLIDCLETDHDRTVVRHRQMSPDLDVTGLMGIPMYGGEFTWGRPRFVGRANVPRPGTMHLMNSPDNDGGVHVSIMLDNEEVEKFKLEFEKGFSASMHQTAKL